MERICASREVTAAPKIWAQAVAAAGTTDGVAVAQALHSGTFHVFGIEARFDEEGNAQGPLGESALWVWHDRRPVPLQADPATGAKSSHSLRDAAGGKTN